MVKKTDDSLPQDGEQSGTWHDQIQAQVKTLEATIKALSERMDDMRTEFDAWGEGNKSSPDKRPMTKADARRALTGPEKDMEHKIAAEAIGLTYAQIYSCRLEYTFKDVHKELRDAGWKNPWKK